MYISGDMGTNHSLMPKDLPANKYQEYLNAISSLAIITGGIFSIISWLQICTQECAATHDYRLFGFQLEYVGMIFFPILSLLHWRAYYKKNLSFMAAIMLAGALGAEIVFIYAQKVWIGQWCPLCLCIAASIVITSLAYLLSYFNHYKQPLPDSKRIKMALNLPKVLAIVMALITGFSISSIGLAKVDELQAAENSIKNSIVFGNLNSKIDAYFFSDWHCPACRQLEPKLKELVPTLMKNTRLTYVDFAIHPSSLNFTPYNLSFMVHDKNKYLELRDSLTQLSSDTETPTDEQIEKIAKEQDAHYTQLNYSEVALGLEYFKTLATEFDIDSTPTLVLVNEKTKKGKKLYGVMEITKENISQAIEILKE
ncbi:hypothetical protein DB42_BQ00190 [Neochlamydia sp. EPS4]|nr:hypothetical protein DB42_BQ00190 [Neochlamydia sp. EPS4]